MVRQARQLCDSSVYHVVLREINRGYIFFDDDNSVRFLDTLESERETKKNELYWYCLMNNHRQLRN